MFGLFNKKIIIEYPNPLPDKVSQLLNEIDNLLVENNTRTTVDTVLQVRYLYIPFSQQHKSIDTLTNMANKQIVKDKAYIPRSVSYQTEANGDWLFYYGIRGDVLSSDIERHLFINALNQTNTMRANYEKHTLLEKGDTSTD